jgi:hypothetical protein
MAEQLLIRRPQQSETKLELGDDPLVIGSDPTCHVVVNDPMTRPV